MKVIEIPLTKGQVALVDEDDLCLLPPGPWQATKARQKRENYYATQAVYKEDGRRTTVFMHHFILPQKDGVEVDHENGCGTDNRRKNLRYATSAQNAANRTYSRTRLFKGVSRSPRHKSKPWIARITVNGKGINSPYFATAEDAARAYDRIAIEHLGEFAKTNFPREDYENEQLPLAA